MNKSREKLGCPACSSQQSEVIGCGPSNKHFRRRRQCKKCYHRWNTVEIPQDELAAMLKQQEMFAKLVRMIAELSEGS